MCIRDSLKALYSPNWGVSGNDLPGELEDLSLVVKKTRPRSAHPRLQQKLKKNNLKSRPYNENKDPKEVVVDEFIGQSIPIYLYEISHGSAKDTNEAVLFYLYIFILFRFFDIKKPFPINFLDKKFKNSFGVIIDDVAAGLYVVLTLIIFMVIKSKFFA